MKKRNVDPITRSGPRLDLQLVAGVPTGDALAAESQKSPVDTPAPDITEFLLSQDFPSLAPKREAEIPSVRKPGKLDFFRIMPEVGAKVLFADIRSDSFLVAPHLAADLQGERAVTWRHLVVARSRAGALFLWPLRVPEDDSGAAPWAESALEAARQALTHWTRIQWDDGACSYKITLATAPIPEPVWPGASIEQLVQRAFGHRVIDSLEHIVLRQLRGEA
jgi:hypothetical protein